MDIVARFWSMVDRSGECWLWLGTRDTHGYGCITVAGKKWTAHRLSYKLTHGSLPNDLFVCHTCDTPPCVRPDHLYLGTPLDNTRDQLTRNRRPNQRGEANYASKLTDDAVREIRRLYAAGGISQSALAKQFNITQSLVSLVILGKAWQHVDADIAPREQSIIRYTAQRTQIARPPWQERFWKRIEVVGSCWNWTGALSKKGYGWVNTGNAPTQAHRVAYTLIHGSIPEGMVVAHTCDNRRCINPDHLQVVEHSSKRVLRTF